MVILMSNVTSRGSPLKPSISQRDFRGARVEVRKNGWVYRRNVGCPKGRGLEWREGLKGKKVRFVKSCQMTGDLNV